MPVKIIDKPKETLEGIISASYSSSKQKDLWHSFLSSARLEDIASIVLALEENPAYLDQLTKELEEKCTSI